MFNYRAFKLACTLIFLLILSTACGQSSSPVGPTPQTFSPSPTIELQAAVLTTPTGPSTAPTLVALPTQPPPTPTVTATPIIYTIESGDTLLGIAIQQGVSLAELQLANPDLRPELLQIGQPVIIPPPEEGEESSQVAATPLPVPLEIRGVGYYRTPVNGLWYLGEVFNNTQTAVQNVRVAVTLIDAKGASSTLDSWVARSLIPPGETAPFGVLFSIHNNGPENATQVSILVTLYDKQNRVTGFIQEAIPEPLEPGDQRSFDIHISPASPFTTHHTVVAGARRGE